MIFFKKEKSLNSIFTISNRYSSSSIRSNSILDDDDLEGFGEFGVFDDDDLEHQNQVQQPVQQFNFRLPTWEDLMYVVSNPYFYYTASIIIAMSGIYFYIYFHNRSSTRHYTLINNLINSINNTRRNFNGIRNNDYFSFGIGFYASRIFNYLNNLFSPFSQILRKFFRDKRKLFLLILKNYFRKK
jgi:hypothetical protein